MALTLRIIIESKQSGIRINEAPGYQRMDLYGDR